MAPKSQAFNTYLILPSFILNSWSKSFRDFTTHIELNLNCWPWIHYLLSAYLILLLITLFQLKWPNPSPTLELLHSLFRGMEDYFFRSLQVESFLPFSFLAQMDHTQGGFPWPVNLIVTWPYLCSLIFFLDFFCISTDF